MINKFISLFYNQTFNFFKLIFLYKTFKVAKFEIVNYIILNHTNIELLVVNT